MLRSFLVLACALMAWCPDARAAGPSGGPGVQVARTTLPDHFYDEAVVTQLEQTIALAFLPDGRLLFAEQKSGRVRMVVNGRLAATDPLLTVDSLSLQGPEWGLLGLAVDPQWPSRPYVYVYYDAVGGWIRISRYTAQGDLEAPGSGMLAFDPASRHDLLREIPDTQDSHNGGCLRFGTDGMLYASLGDDQSPCASQDSVGLRGVILRLDVSKLSPSPGITQDEQVMVPTDNPLASHPDVHARFVWAMGLRNPFRFHVDPIDGSLFIADVGWVDWEEIDHAAQPGLNFGWPYLEGPLPYASACPGLDPEVALMPPIYAMPRDGAITQATIGAGVYRRPACADCGFPAEYEGDYFFSDFYSGALRRIHYGNGTWALAAPAPGQPSLEDWGRGFGEVVDYVLGPDGALWYARLSDDFRPQTGEIHRIVYAQPAAGAGTPALQDDISFAPPWPAPARLGSHFEFGLPRAAEVSLALYDAQGRRVRTLLDRVARDPGRHGASWDGRTDLGTRAPPGVYLARLTAEGRSFSRRIVWVP